MVQEAARTNAGALRTAVEEGVERLEQTLMIKSLQLQFGRPNSLNVS
jgi:hypothetical protein